MKQKTFIRNLLLFSLLSFLTSCGETITEETAYKNYILKNNSNYTVEIEGYKNGSEYIFPIDINEVLSQRVDLQGDNNNNPVISMDSIAITFDSNKVSIFYKGVNTDSSFNIFNIDNYTTTQVNNNETSHEYIFTIEDYENAQ